MLNNNRGQIAETITWVVATMIVVVTLIVFIFISTTLSKGKVLDEVSTGIEKFFLSDDAGKISRIETKTKLALSIDEKNKEIIDGWIGRE